MSETSLILKAAAADSGHTEPESGKRRRILLVEGDGFTRLVLLLRLKLAGFGVDFTSNGTLGLGKLRSCRPDVLLVELKLCGLSGLDLIKAARSDPLFGHRPVYVFTHVERMHRGTRKELGSLGVKLVDKASMTRERLVQTLEAEFLGAKPTPKQPVTRAAAEPQPSEALGETVVPGVIEEIIAGVRDQSERLARCKETAGRTAGASELLSRTSSLASCAEAAGLLQLARHAKALENYLKHICRKTLGCNDEALSAIRRCIEAMGRMSFEAKDKEQKPSRLSAVIVDEAPNSNRALTEALRNAGFEPVSFEEAPRAHEHLASNRTDLIIANVLLPEAHGLALAEIRRLPLHEKTPVIFGPESTITVRQGDELPTSAPRLDMEPMLLAQLVLRVLNELQSKGKTRPAPPTSMPPAPGRAQQPVANPGANSAGGLVSDDVFELFARPQRDASASAAYATAQSAALPAETVHQPLRWSATSLPGQDSTQANPQQEVAMPADSEQPDEHLHASGLIQNEPISHAEPCTAGVDREAEFLARLPAAAPIDGSQTDERPIEVLPLSNLQATEPQSPQAEPTGEDQANAGAWLAAAATGETDRPTQASHMASEFQETEAAAAQESAEATLNHEEVMKNQLQATPGYFEQQYMARQQALDSNGHEHPNEDLAARACASEMALYQAQAQIEQKDKTIEALQQQLAEAAPAQFAAESPAEASEAEQKAQARCAELEQEVAALRQVFEHFNNGLGPEQQAAADTAKAESEAARQQAEARCAELEQEATSLRQAREELADKLAHAQKAGAEADERLKKLEAQAPVGESGTGAAATDQEEKLRQGVAALAKFTAGLAKERGARQRSERRASDLNDRLQTLHEDLKRGLQAQREDQQRISALEEQERQIRQDLEERTAELEQQQDEHRLTEEQLQKAKEVNAQLRKDLSFFEGANKQFVGARQELQTRLEANLNAARENEALLEQENSERQRLVDNLESAQRELQNQTHKREIIEQELETARGALQESEGKLQKETAERQRLKDALDSFQRKLRDGSERDLEVAKLQSALHAEQVERKRQETQLARMRLSAQEAVHAARALRTSLRRQIREPVDSLVNSARSLLELETGEEQRKLAEAVLQDVLLVQTRLREPEPARGEPAANAETPATQAA
jgi:CheY-like chemotaxis protein